jgi:hypothetical protein
VRHFVATHGANSTGFLVVGDSDEASSLRGSADSRRWPRVGGATRTAACYRHTRVRAVAERRQGGSRALVSSAPSFALACAFGASYFCLVREIFGRRARFPSDMPVM